MDARSLRIGFGAVLPLQCLQCAISAGCAGRAIINAPAGSASPHLVNLPHLLAE